MSKANHISTLCSRLVSVDDSTEAQSTSAELQAAIRNSLERVRQDAFDTFDFAMDAHAAEVVAHEPRASEHSGKETH